MSTARLLGKRWRVAVVAAASSALVAGVSLTGGGSAAAEPAFEDCPAPFPVADLTEGMTASGLTVEKGTAAEPFTAEIIGVIDDGITADVDMIVAETDSPAIQRAGGIWAGMSGSPVYAPDGRLIGAVSYGLSLAPSSIAGITPAADIMRVLDRPGSASVAAKTAKETAIPSAMRSSLVRSGAASSAEANSGMKRLPMPVAVSGLGGDRLATFSERLGRQARDTQVYPAGAAAAGAVGDPADIFPGSNFAAALSHGDLTAAGVGTTTVLCSDGRALASGIPSEWSGASTMSVHSAKAVFVQRDDTLGSYKVANPQGVVGTLDQDRLAAIRGVLGAGPATVPVNSTVTSTDSGGGSRAGKSEITARDFVPLLSGFHLLASFDKVTDRIGKGTADLRWVIKGTRVSGASFILDVRNRYADEFDIGFAAIFDSLNQLAAIDGNSFEDAKVTSVDYTADVSSEFTRYAVKSVHVRQPDGTRTPIPTGDPLPVVAGSRLNLRVVLAPYKNIGSKRNVDLSIVVPAGLGGGSGFVHVFGGPQFDESEPEGGSGAENFDELLAELAGLVPNNSVTATLAVAKEGLNGPILKQTEARAIVDQVVAGERSFPITAEPRHRSGYRSARSENR